MTNAITQLRTALCCWLCSFVVIVALPTNAADFKALGGLFDNKTHIGQFEPDRTRQVLQDSQGFIWVASEANGLLRFDGTQASKIDFQASFVDLTSQLRIESIVEDNQQHIWVRTLSQGVFRYAPKTQWIDRFEFPVTNSANTQVISLIKDSKGELWMATRSHIARFNLAQNQWQLITTLNQQPLPEGIAFKKLFVDSQQTFWLVSEQQGIFKFSADGMHHFIHKEGQSNGLASNGIMSFLEDKQGNIWFGTTAGLAAYNAQNHSFETIPLSDQPMQGYQHLVTSIAQRDADHLWLGTFQSGVMLFDKASKSVSAFSDSSENSINNQEINHLFVDDNQTLWASTEVGVSNSTTLTRAIGQWQHQNSQSCHPVGFIEIESSVYFACANNLYQWQPTTKAVQTIATFATPILTLAAGQSEHIWLGSLFGGLLHHDLKQGKTTAYPVNDGTTNSSASVLKLYRDQQGVLWGSSFDFQGGQQRFIFRYSKQSDKLISFATQLNTVSITDLDDQHLLLGGFLEQQGPFIFDKTSGQITNAQYATGTISSALNVGGTIWLGTSDMGLVKYHPQAQADAQFETIDNSVTSPLNLISDGRNGVYFHDNDKVFHRAAAADKSECLSCDSAFPKLTSLYRGSVSQINKRLFIGSLDMAIELDLPSFTLPKAAPKVYLSDLSLFNRTVQTQVFDPQSPLPLSISHLSELTLNHDQPFLSLHFGAQALLQPQHIRFYYQLSGLNNDWLTSGRNIHNATFTTLPAGEYQFRVKAIDESSGLSDETAIKVIIKSAPWLSLPAKLGYILLLLGAIFGVINLRTRTLKTNADKLQQGITLRTQELNDKTQLLASKNDTILGLLAQKRRMFANMSHEFRTPLTLILSPLERLFSAQLNSGNQKFLSIIDRNARQLLRMVEQLLNLAQLETTNRIQYKQYKVNQSLKYVISSFEAVILDKHLSLNTEFENEFSATLIDDSLETIIANLLSNAIKYTPEQGAINIVAKQQAQQLVLSVSDTGLGIASKDQLRVLEPFYRDDDESKSNIEGCGIGLALVKELVDANHGRLTLDSELGRGSCFTIYLPVTQQNDDITFAREKSNGGESVIAASLESLAGEQITQHNQPIDLPFATGLDNKPSLVIVEDNRDMRDFLFDILNEDYHCLPAHNGKEGLRLITEQIPDLVICDLMMPGIDGLQVCNTLKNDERTSHIPLLLLTAKGDTETRISGWRENIDDFVSKPFNETELKARLKNMLTIRSILKKRYGQQMQLSSEVIQSNSYLNEKDQAFLDRFKTAVTSNLADETFNRSKAASLLAVSERQLQRKLSALTDHTFSEYVRFTRLEQAKVLLGTGLLVSQVIEQVGFSSLSYFGACFKAEFGQTAKQFQQGLSHSN